MRLAQAVHRIGRFERGLLVDMDKGALPFAGGIGDPGDAFLDEFARRGAACLEIVGERGKGRIRHGCFA